MTSRMVVTFWGTRGGLPCPGSDTVVYGGDTSCVELRCGERTIVFDAGSGIRRLGRRLLAEGRLDLDLVLSHTHIDHLIGLPFFAPLFRPEGRLRVWAGRSAGRVAVSDALEQLMMPPLFPVTPEVFAAAITYRDMEPGERVDLGDGIALSSAALNHPGGATGYRIDFAGRSFGYVTDHETTGTPDPALAELTRGLDLLAMDASYTPLELAPRRGWGHSTWRQVADLAASTGVKRLALFHHDPAHDDAAMAAIEDEAAAHRPGTFAARDGQTIAL